MLVKMNSIKLFKIFVLLKFDWFLFVVYQSYI